MLSEGRDDSENSELSDYKKDFSAKKKLLASKMFVFFKGYESLALSLQRLLVWENLTHSSIFLVLANFMFFYVYAKFNNIFGFIFSCILTVFWVDLLKEKIWPEIRAVAPSRDSEWGELNPKLLSFYEICEAFSTIALKIKEYFSLLLELRSKNHTKFFVKSCCFCFLGCIAGMYISSVFIFHFIFCTILLYPCLVYHDLLDKVYVFLELYVGQLLPKINPENNFSTNTNLKLSPSNDEEYISEFIPPNNDNTAVVLARALSGNSQLSDVDEVILAKNLPGFSNKSLKSTSNDIFEDSAVRMPTPEEIIENSESDDDDDHIGFVPSPSYTAPSTNAFLSPKGNQVLNNLITGISENSANDLNKIVKDGIVASLTQFNLTSNNSNFNNLKNSETSTPSEDFEVLNLID